MKLLINYADSTFKTSQRLNSKTGISVGGFDKVISYSPKDIDKVFFRINKEILSQKRGAGYWLWKPYFIRNSLELLNEGEFLFYCDSGAIFTGSITPLINICLETGQDIIPFELFDHLEMDWTKRDAFVLMHCDDLKYATSRQRLGGYSLWRKSELTNSFVNDFLTYAQNENILTDSNNITGCPNYEGFKGHRHDQSIFSLLTKKYNLKAYRDPSQFGNPAKDFYPESDYKQLVYSTRKRDLTLLRKITNGIREFGYPIKQKALKMWKNNLSLLITPLIICTTHLSI